LAKREIADLGTLRRAVGDPEEDAEHGEEDRDLPRGAEVALERMLAVRVGGRLSPVDRVGTERGRDAVRRRHREARLRRRRARLSVSLEQVAVADERAEVGATSNVLLNESCVSR
jgi:hypothetical protein